MKIILSQLVFYTLTLLRNYLDFLLHFGGMICLIPSLVHVGVMKYVLHTDPPGIPLHNTT